MQIRLLKPIYSSGIFFLVFFTSLFNVACSDDLAFQKKKVYEENKQPTPTNIQDEISNSRQNAITKAISSTRNAVVGINVIELKEFVINPFGFDPFFNDFFRMFNQKMVRQVQSLGSGFIISPDGYVVTNDHVAGNAKKIIVTLTDGRKYEAKIIGTDPVSDVALLKIDAENLPYIKFGDSDNLIVGEWAIAMGNPFGLFDINSKPTVTVGVISNLGINMINEGIEGNRIYKNMIQTDAAISSGNSGGPLLNSNGEVIGMNTVIYSTAKSSQGAGSIGIGFAIPVNRLKQLIDELIENGKIERATYSGMDVDNLDDNYKKNYRIDVEHGAIVTRIYRRSPAERAGIEPADVIVAVNGKAIYHANDLLVEILDGRLGQKFKLDIIRGGEKISKTLVLENSRR
mgnify:CR=1 FL=1